MGKVLKIIEKVKKMTHLQLLERYEHIVKAEAARDYAGMKKDIELGIEIRITGEEIMKRLLSSHPIVSVGVTDKPVSKNSATIKTTQS
jgi:hypothetical protein